MHNNDITFHYLNTLMNKWKSQFEEQPSMEHLSITIDENDMILLAGHPVCKASLLATEEYDVNPEHVELFLTNRDSITIEILWKHNHAPVISAICMHHFMYCLTE